MSPSKMPNPERKWWKDAVVYQIFPASFKDSSGDGKGDIPGIIGELDYIRSIGVDIIWLCPIFDSPQYDAGYDISNYEAVYPAYGTLADVERLIKECHHRGMRLILDLVINHTSHEHPWFKESRSSKSNPKRDWYIWRPPSYDEEGHRRPPNNWRALFNGTIWEWDEATQEYYLHLFTPQQPDLNWENPETRQAIYKTAMTFWLDKGVDGFRIDTVNLYSKDPALLNMPYKDKPSGAGLFFNGPRIHEYLEEMNEQVLSKYDAMTAGELPATPDQKKVLKYVSAKVKQVNMAFQSDLVSVGLGSGDKFETTPKNFTLPDVKKAIDNNQGLLDETDAWSLVYLENHDQPRSISRFASDEPEHRAASGKMLSTMLTALSGTIYIYQGEEIGMVNVPREWPIDEYKDVEALNYYNHVKKLSGGDPEKLREAMDMLHYLARDNARTPMQWDDSANAGFTKPEVKPWMRVNDNYREINVAQQRKDKKSVLAFWKRMLALRKEYAELFIYGSYKSWDLENLNTYTFTKEADGLTALVAINFTEKQQSLSIPKHLEGKKLRLLISNMDREDHLLAPLEGRIYLVE